MVVGLTGSHRTAADALERCRVELAGRISLSDAPLRQLMEEANAALADLSLLHVRTLLNFSLPPVYVKAAVRSVYQVRFVLVF